MRNWKRITVLVLILCMMLSMTGCDVDEEALQELAKEAAMEYVEDAVGDAVGNAKAEFDEKMDGITDAIGQIPDGLPQADILPNMTQPGVIPDPDCSHSNPEKYTKKKRLVTCECGARIFDVGYETFKGLVKPPYWQYWLLHMFSALPEEEYYTKEYIYYKGEIPAFIEVGILGTYEEDPVNQTAQNTCTCSEYIAVYGIRVENEDRSIQIYCSSCDAYITDREITEADFLEHARYAIEMGLYTQEQAKVMYSLYKAQDVGPQMLGLLHTIGMTGKISPDSDEGDIRVFLEKFKDYYDLAFAIAEHDEQILNCATAEEFQEFLLGEDGAAFLKWGDTTEEIAAVMRTAANIYQFGTTAEKNDGSADSAAQSTAALLDVIGHIIDFAPDVVPMSMLYSKQLEMLSQSCENYFVAYADYQNFVGFQEDFIEGTSPMFQDGVFTPDQYNTLTLGIRDEYQDIRDYWSQSHMPDLNTVLGRLGKTNEEGVSVYNRLSEKEQLLVTKYVEYRIHYEFERHTGITLAYYYELIQRNPGIFSKDTPWEKEIDIHDYETSFPT